MLTKWFVIIGGVAALFLSGGCGKAFYPQNETPLERNWGRSIEAARISQVLYPAAQKNLTPVAGFDGEAARRNLEKYHTSFEKEAPQPTYRLSFGNIAEN